MLLPSSWRALCVRRVTIALPILCWALGPMGGNDRGRYREKPSNGLSVRLECTSLRTGKFLIHR